MARSLFEPFSQPALHISRGGFLDTSCRSRDRVPLIMGFSSIRTWVTQPRHELWRFGIKQFYQASGEAHHLFCPYKGIRIHSFSPMPSSSLLTHSRTLELQRPSSRLSSQTTPSMSGAGGKRMVSLVTEENITKLREAGYLAADIAHWLPDARGTSSLRPHPMRG